MKFIFNPTVGEANNDQKWEQIRLWRNAELKNTDWTQISDAPVDKNAWAVYRQELRDLPNKYDLADDVEYPEKP